MSMNKYHVRRFIWAILLTGSMAFAGGPEYLGFSLNINTQDDVKKTLKARGANFNTNYGYKGYAKDLPTFKVTSDPIMSAQGQLQEAWLYFTPQDRLYKIEVTWADAGKTYQVVKDVLDDKYRSTSTTRDGFKWKHNYFSDKVHISLLRNTFGFGANQKTTLIYTYQPAITQVEMMQRRIDRHIKEQNVKNKGKNL